MINYMTIIGDSLFGIVPAGTPKPVLKSMDAVASVFTRIMINGLFLDKYIGEEGENKCTSEASL